MAFTFSSPPTYAQIAARCPAIGTPTAAYQTWMGSVSEEVFARLDSGFWGNERPLAAALLTAHAYLKDAAAAKSGGATVGKVNSKSVQDWSASYDTTGGTGSAEGDADLRSTVYGVDYLRLRAARFAVGFQGISK
ncbi:MAG: DUF4054 domain-containing protein [Desulfurellales bacterium]|nr:MAG: DUF4054 domain-containing protein [Desulfurellales bacterium]